MLVMVILFIYFNILEYQIIGGWEFFQYVISRGAGIIGGERGVRKTQERGCNIFIAYYYYSSVRW